MGTSNIVILSPMIVAGRTHHPHFVLCS